MAFYKSAHNLSVKDMMLGKCEIKIPQKADLRYALCAGVAYYLWRGQNEDLPRFAAELSNLLNSFGRYELKVICCDAAIQSVETFSHDVPFNARKFKFNGGGGTAFSPVFDYLEKEQEPPDVLIYLTDGYGDTPSKPSYPVLWGITKDGKIASPGDRKQSWIDAVL